MIAMRALAIAIIALTGPMAAMGQEVQLADANGGPRFIAEPSGNRSAPVVDVRNAAVFRREIALDLRDQSVNEAVEAIARAARLEISFSPRALATTVPVSLTSHRISVGAALTAVLFEAGVDVQLARDGVSMALVPRAGVVVPTVSTRPQQSTATITGHVTDAALKTPLSDVTIRVEGTTLGTTANTDGKYALTGVAPGAYRVTARRVGYQPLTKDITVARRPSGDARFRARRRHRRASMKSSRRRSASSGATRLGTTSRRSMRTRSRRRRRSRVSRI